MARPELIETGEIRDPVDDRFDYGAIVDELRHLITTIDPPKNIALFGPWGSGKSSVGRLLLNSLRTATDDQGRPRPIPCAYFDVFKFPDRSLRRRFIKRMRAELAGRHDDSDLHDDRTWTQYAPPRRDIGRLIFAFVAVLAMVAATGLAVAAFAAAVSEGPTGRAFTNIVNAYVLGTVLAASVMGALLTAVAKGMGVERKVGAPSGEDEFEQLFRDVLDKVESEKVVVFVDELDRCPADTVVATLDGLRTFLDVGPCIFVVAADQQVLEHALTRRLRQATPADATNPYYSVGSAFLDKVFHFQLALPPLRTARLEGYARGHVDDATGIWTRVDDKRYLLSVLIPPHVTSPRRVNVLLNSFALTYRMLLRRGGITNLGIRAPELAKLVCLRCEFPLFAADLHTDPELPDLMLRLAAEPERDLDGVAPERVGRARDYVNGVLPAAQVLAGGDEDARGGSTEVDTRAIRSQHLHQLLQYLRETEAITGPDRDLIHAQGLDTKLPHGVAEELASVARLGNVDELDRLLLDIGITSYDGLDGVEPERAALGVLADMVRRRDPQAKQNAVRVLLRAVNAWSWSDEVLDQDTARELASALALEISRAGETPDEQRGLLRIGIVSGRQALIARVLKSPEARKDRGVREMALAAAPALIDEWSEALGELWADALVSLRPDPWDSILRPTLAENPGGGALDTPTAVALLESAVEPARLLADSDFVMDRLDEGIGSLAAASRPAEAEAAAAILIAVAQERDPLCLVNDAFMQRVVGRLGGLHTPGPALRVIEMLVANYPTDRWAEALRHLKLGDIDPPRDWHDPRLVRTLLDWAADEVSVDDGLPPQLAEVVHCLPTKLRERIVQLAGLRFSRTGLRTEDSLARVLCQLRFLRALCPPERWPRALPLRDRLGDALQEALDGTVADPDAASAGFVEIVRTLAANPEADFDDQLRVTVDSSRWLLDAARVRLRELTA